MIATPATQAIQLALEQRWDEAITLNQEIISQNPTDVDALKRLAYAFLQHGDLQKAKKQYQEVLKIDKYNPIAKKALRKLEGSVTIEKSTFQGNGTARIAPTKLFLEEPGRTKVVNLINLAPSAITCHLPIGQSVQLVAKKRGVEARLDERTYLGALPDDIAHRLGMLITGGNVYEAWIKQVGKNTLSIFIREIKRAPKLQNTISFTGASSNYIPYIREGFLDDEKPDTAALDDEETTDDDEE